MSRKILQSQCLLHPSLNSIRIAYVHKSHTQDMNITGDSLKIKREPLLELVIAKVMLYNPVSSTLTPYVAIWRTACKNLKPITELSSLKGSFLLQLRPVPTPLSRRNQFHPKSCSVSLFYFCCSCVYQCSSVSSDLPLKSKNHRAISRRQRSFRVSPDGVVIL